MSIIHVQEYNAKGDGVTDDTASIQAAILDTKPGDSVLVPAGTFMIDPLVGGDNYAAGGLFLKSDMDLVLAPGAVLKAIPNGSTHYTMVTAKGCTNTRILGPGTILGDRDAHENQNVQGWWGFGISVFGGSANVAIQNNLTVAKCWGDGITVLGASKVLIDHVTVDSHRRQNISVVEGDQITITNCTIKNAAMAGIDLESDTNQVISNVLIQHNSFANSGGAVDIGVGSATGIYKHITINNNQHDLKSQPIFVHDAAGSGGTPWWAFLLNRVLYQGLHASWYRFDGYPLSWSSS